MRSERESSNFPPGLTDYRYGTRRHKTSHLLPEVSAQNDIFTSRFNRKGNLNRSLLNLYLLLSEGNDARLRRSIE